MQYADSFQYADKHQNAKEHFFRKANPCELNFLVKGKTQEKVKCSWMATINPFTPSPFSGQVLKFFLENS